MLETKPQQRPQDMSFNIENITLPHQLNKKVESIKTYNVHPELVKYQAPDKGFGVHSHRGAVIDGDWDLDYGLFNENNTVYLSMKARIEDGARWEDTIYYRHISSALAKRGPTYRFNTSSGLQKCATNEQLLERCYQFLDVLLLQTAQLGRVPEKYMKEDNISVHIGRRGQVLFCNGNHRLAAAKLLNVKQVPIEITVRHPMWVAVKNEIQKYADRQNGTIYTHLEHVDLQEFKIDQPDRIDAIIDHMSSGTETVLDIGAHWGYHSGILENAGKKCVAVEAVPMHYNFMEIMRVANEHNFETYLGSIWDYVQQNRKFDCVLALRIFHHFTKTEASYRGLKAMLGMLDMNEMFFQPHYTHEHHMQTAYKNFTHDEFIRFVLDNSCLGNFEQISDDPGRAIYRLYR